MKKAILIFLIALVGTVTVQSQEKTFRFGPTVGVEFPFTTGSLELGNGSEPSEQVRGQFGVAVNLSFSDKIGLQPEILYQVRVVDGETNDLSYSNSYGYVLVPILFDLKLVSGLSLQAGPRIGIQVAKDEDGSLNQSNGFLTANNTEVAAVFGPQYITPFGLFFNLRGEYTFTNVYSTGDLNSGGAALSIGWFF